MSNKFDCRKARRTSNLEVKAELVQLEEEAECDARWAYEAELLEVFDAIHGDSDDWYTDEELPDGISLQR